MDLQLSSKTALISGSTQGIGYAIAEALLREGVAVTVNGRSAARVRAAVRRLEAVVPGALVSGVAADFAQPDEVGRLLDSLGQVDILVNNVGLFELRPFVDIPDADWQRYLDVNLMSSVRLSRHLLPVMLERRWGRIIFIGSESGVNVPADMLHYGVTKAGMLALANGLAKLTRGTEVTVHTILGGPTYSDGVAETVTRLAEEQSLPTETLKHAIAAQNGTSLVQRFLDPSEIANLAMYLASPLSSATNGAAVRADGGALTAVL
jgi:NAD(P)-dependent dehydrogenase (short-subunit alcohol dehydrogenase family)